MTSTRTRPLGVTLSCGLALVYAVGGFLAFLFLFTAGNPVAFFYPFHMLLYAFMAAAGLVALGFGLTAVLAMKGVSWARWALIAAYAALGGVIGSAADVGLHSLIPLLNVAAIVGLLIGGADDWFRRRLAGN